MSEIAQIVKSSTEVKQVLDADVVMQHLAKQYTTIHGGNGIAKFESEKHAFLRLISDNAQLQSCDRISLYGCFVDAIVQNLTFTGNLVYLIPYGKTAKLSLSPYGEVSLRIMNGSLKHADNPVIVYDCDKFTVKDNKPSHDAVYPRPADAKPIAGYVRLVIGDETEMYFVMSIQEVMALKKYSKMPKLYGNAADGSGIDIGFMKAKVLKHSMKALPKIDLRGKFTEIPDQVQDEDIYGMEIPNADHSHLVLSADDDPEPSPLSVSKETSDNDVPF